LKDHLGNLRFAFRDETAALSNDRRRWSRPMRPEEQEFAHVAETRQRDALHARTGDYVPSFRLPKAGAWPKHQLARAGRRQRDGRGLRPLRPYSRRWSLPRKGALVAGAGVAGSPACSSSTSSSHPPHGVGGYLPNRAASHLCRSCSSPSKTNCPARSCATKLFSGTASS
jgi:hypothetical protein